MQSSGSLKRRCPCSLEGRGSVAVDSAQVIATVSLSPAEVKYHLKLLRDDRSRIQELFVISPSRSGISAAFLVSVQRGS